MPTDRIARVRACAAEQEAAAALITFLPDIRWATGFTGSNALLLVLPDSAHLVTDGRYTLQARREVTGAEVHITSSSLLRHVVEAEWLPEGAVAVYQADHLTVAALNAYHTALPDVVWKGAEDLLVEEVAVKAEEEIARMRGAQRITEEVFEHLLGFLRPGLTEQEVAAEITYQHLRRGAEKLSFDPIVASGPQGALPHARPTDRELQSGELVVLDFGCFADGYASDMTRTVALGEPGPEARRVYDVVLRAQEAALEAARAGIKSPDLDGVARRSIENDGLGEFFTHSLGHGVGLQIHEWPRVSRVVDYTLPAGAVVTIEPGVYIPDRFGVRIEDVVVLREGGCENLTSAPKDLIIL